MNLVLRYQGGQHIKSVDLQNADEQELLHLLGLVKGDIADIGVKVSSAEEYALTSGTYYDSDWFHRATMAKKLKGKLVQYIELEIAKRNKKRKEFNHQQKQQGDVALFLKAMDLVLTPEQKDKVMAMVRELRIGTENSNITERHW